MNWYLELSSHSLVRSDIIALAAGYTCWNLTRWVTLRLQKQFPGLANTRYRIIWMGALLPVLVNFAWSIRQLGHLALNNTPQLSESISGYTYAIGIQIFYHCVYFVIYEGSYDLRAWQYAYEQNEQLKKNKLKHQLDTLKAQINPHFLFNSLNSLSMLIHDNPKQAEAFVDEISSVYRYLLRANDQALTTLAQEIQFIKSYFQLLKTRYGTSINLRIDVADGCLDCLIPPLTLQLLVENAVKHNIMLPSSPLVVEITIQGRSLVVQNNLQRKNTPVLSNQVGLANISTKYRLLGQTNISIREDNGQFTVVLPLLSAKPETNVLS
ncbi:hypothetical protein GCM10027592_49950 [Spirosoma flavus]